MELRSDSLFFISGPTRNSIEKIELDAMAEYLRANLGCIVINPMELRIEKDTRVYDDICSECIAVSDAVVLMDKWHQVQESHCHFKTAVMLGIDVIFASQIPMIINNIK